MIHLWLLIVPQSQFSYDKMGFFDFLTQKKQVDIYNPNKFNKKQKEDYNVLLDSVIDTIMTTDSKIPFFELIKKAESNNNPLAKNPKSTAKGVYQFLDGTVENVKNQGINLGFNKKYIKNIPNNPHDWTDDEADVMAAINLFVQPNTDKLLEQAIEKRDIDAMTELYYKNHHTDPDLMTKYNWNKTLLEYEPEKKSKASWLMNYMKSFFK